jgi:hypothetical protein
MYRTYVSSLEGQGIQVTAKVKFIDKSKSDRISEDYGPVTSLETTSGENSYIISKVYRISALARRVNERSNHLCNSIIPRHRGANDSRESGRKEDKGIDTRTTNSGETRGAQ